MGTYRGYNELDGTSVEAWAKELDQRKKRILSKNEVAILIQSSLKEKEIEEDKDGEFTKMLEGWNGVAILYRRLQVHTFTMSKAALFACGLMVESPGEAVMMANYIQYRCHKQGIRHVDMRALSHRVLPDGWFGQDTLAEFWEKQKYVSEDGRLVNMLDTRHYATSIHFR